MARYETQSYAARKRRGLAPLKVWVTPRVKAALALLSEHYGGTQTAAISFAILRDCEGHGLTRELDKLEREYIAEREEAATAPVETKAAPKARKTSSRKSTARPKGGAE